QRRLGTVSFRDALSLAAPRIAVKCRSLLVFLGPAVSWLVTGPVVARTAGEPAQGAAPSTSVLGRPGTGARSEAATGIVPPALVQAAAPRIPEAALAEGVSVRVVLELVIDAEGMVTSAVVRRSAGAVLDAAVLEAARASR